MNGLRPYHEVHGKGADFFPEERRGDVAAATEDPASLRSRP